MVDDGILVTGTGTASGAPDVVRAGLAAVTVRPRLADALSAAEQAARRVRDVLGRFGIAGTDVATAGLSVSAEQVWTEDAGARVTGYRCEHSLAVTLRDVAAVGPVLGEALLAGADDVLLHGLEFAVEDAAGLRAVARDRAWADVQARAGQLAGLAGRPLGGVVAVEESDAVHGRPVPVPDLARASAAADLTVEPGRVSVEVCLTVRWGLS